VTGNNTTATATGTVSMGNGNKTITITLGTVNVTQGGLATGTQRVTMSANALLKDLAGNGATGSATVTPLF
jgi:hypothetical protein